MRLVAVLERYRRIDNMAVTSAVLPLFVGSEQYEVLNCEVTKMRNDMTYITFHCRYGQLSIHRGCIEKMGQPRYIQILVNPDTKELALRPSDGLQKNSFAVSERLYSAKADFGISKS